LKCVVPALAAWLAVSSLAAEGGPSASKSGGKSTAKAVAAKLTGPKRGVKTPGVQIPFTQLKAEATLATPDKPAWLYFAPQGPGALYAPAADKVLKFEAKANAPVDPIPAVKKPCGGIVNAFASLWVPSCGDGALLRLDPRSFKVKATIATGTADLRGTVAASSDSIWLITDGKQTIARIDPDQDAVVAEFRVPVGCSQMLFAETSLWLACPEQNKVLRINPATNLVDKRIDVGAKPVALASGQGAIWVLCGKEGKIDRIDPKTDKVSKTIDLGVPDSTGALAFGDGFLWATVTGFPLTRIEVADEKEKVAQQFWGEGGGGILVSAGAIWLSNLNDGTVSRIDPKLVLATLAE
jgi:streptogramin lyase